MKELLVVALFAFTFLLGGICGQQRRPAQPEDCITMQVVADNTAFGGQAVIVGDVKVCGVGLHFTGMTGPSEKPPFGDLPGAWR